MHSSIVSTSTCSCDRVYSQFLNCQTIGLRLPKQGKKLQKTTMVKKKKKEAAAVALWKYRMYSSPLIVILRLVNGCLFAKQERAHLHTVLLHMPFKFYESHKNQSHYFSSRAFKLCIGRFICALPSLPRCGFSYYQHQAAQQQRCIESFLPVPS